jgi:acyl-[acyl-carrier-protein]-phospholipid O-acyltransferase/long-chain-fatty-acid--[acyl-carrier-protein] ligase
MPRIFSSFSFLNITQLLTALNDNLYKLLLIYFLISIEGEKNTNTILALAGAVFVIPFLLFASLAGSLADRFSKRSIIYVTRMTEILTMCLGVLAFYFHSPFGVYAVLFLAATQSAIFSPCKYGIIPEIVPEKKISRCNGIITATTYLAIILGTFLASFLTEILHKKFVIAGLACLIIACLGLLSSLGIEKTRPQASKKKVSTRFILDILAALKAARNKRYLLTTLIFGAYFLFIGSFTQLNIIPFTLQSLQLSDVQGGYLFLMTAIGIGIGSYLAGQLSGKDVELGFIPLAALGIMLCYLGLYFFDSHFYVVVPLLVVLGVCGGFYIVPVDAYIQVASPDKDRGVNVATANFLSFIGVIIASGLLALLGNGLNLSAAQGFYVVGWITFSVALFLFVAYADQVLRLAAACYALLFLKVRIWGKARLLDDRSLLLIAPRSSWLDTVIMLSILPRRIRYIVPIEANKQQYRHLYKWMRFIPLEHKHFLPFGPSLELAIKKEIASGNSVCLMQPVDQPLHTLAAWEEKLPNVLPDMQTPILPIHILREETPKQGRFAQLLSLRKAPIKISLGQIQTKN